MIERANYEVAFWNYRATAERFREGNVDAVRFNAARTEMEARMAELDAAEAFNTELTDVGEQYVIPGTERNASAKAGEQLNLF